MRVKRKFGKLGKRHFKGVCHCFVESARTCGAFIVHCKVFDGAVLIDRDTFDVLTADVDNRLNGRIGNVHAHCVAGYFGNVFVGKGDLVAPVARADEITQFFRGVKTVHFAYRFRHSGSRAFFRPDFAAYGCVRRDFPFSSRMTHFA